MRGIAHLCNHRAELWRATATVDSLGDRIETWVPQVVPDGMNCRPNQAWSGSLQDRGPGEQQRALRQWFLLCGFDVRERDVLEITCGPEEGVLLRVESVTPTTDPRRVHHIEVNVEVWHGSLS